MEIKKTFTSEVTRTIDIICDSCMMSIKRETYYKDEVKISHTKGDSYPEGSNFEVYSPDICSTCFEQKILPLLKTMCVLV